MKTLHHELLQYHRFVVPDRILVATSLEDTDYLIPHALAQANASKAGLILAHVVPPPAEPPSIDPGAVSPVDALSMKHEAAAKLNSIAAEIRRSGVPCDVSVRYGFPRDQIMEIICETNAGRVVAGTHGRQRLERFLLGSVAEALIRNSPAPVFIVGPHAHDSSLVGPPRRLLHLVPMNRHYEEIASLALDLARYHGADITFLCVFEDADEKDLRDNSADEGALLQRISAAGCSHIHVNIRKGSGDIPEQAVRLGSEIGADLIVMGLYPSPPPLPFHRDHTAYRIICEAKSPVLSVRACES